MKGQSKLQPWSSWRYRTVRDGLMSPGITIIRRSATAAGVSAGLNCSSLARESPGSAVSLEDDYDWRLSVRL